nr:MAG TPA: hypothetical protein [Caudoviricetes sp.]
MSRTSDSLESYVKITSRCSFFQIIGNLDQDCPIFNLVTIHE